MTTDNASPDPVVTAAETAWLDYAKGTWSETDRRIFVEGFRRGDLYRQQQRLKELRRDVDHERHHEEPELY